MQQALERVTKSIEQYSAGDLSRSVATIELVSAFTVAFKASTSDQAALQAAVQAYIDAVLASLDNGEFDATKAVSELHRVYQAAYTNNPNVLAYMTRYL